MLIEILGNNLDDFFINLKIEEYGVVGARSYKSEMYEVWAVNKEIFKKMCAMSDDEFIALASEYAWWRYSEGSVLGYPDTTKIINGHRLKCWSGERLGNAKRYSSLTEYLCECVGASTAANITACATDLAKYNSMSLGELFTKYQPIETTTER